MSSFGEGPKMAQEFIAMKEKKLKKSNPNITKVRKKKPKRLPTRITDRESKNIKFDELPPELTGVKIDTNAIPILGDAVEQMFRRKLEEKVQKDPLLAVFGDEIDDDLRRKIDRKVKKRKRERKLDVTSEKKKAQKKSNGKNDERRRLALKSAVMVPGSSKWDKYDTATVSRSLSSVVQRRISRVHTNKPLSHGEWRDNRWQGLTKGACWQQGGEYGHYYDNRRGECWPPAAPTYHWDDGRRQDWGSVQTGADESMYTFKEFLLSQPSDFVDQEEGLQAYNDYKLQFRKKALEEFFQAHSEDEWFLDKYHPMLRSRREKLRRQKVRTTCGFIVIVVARRLDVFMQLMVHGYMEIAMDISESKKIRKLMDAVIVVMEGGDEGWEWEFSVQNQLHTDHLTIGGRISRCFCPGDIACLKDLDYLLEEKREQTYQMKTHLNDDDDWSSDDEETVKEEETETNPRKIPDTIGKAPGQGRTKDVMRRAMEWISLA